MSNLIQPQELRAILEAPDTVVLDGSWYLPTQNRDPQAEYQAQHIPGARFFDIDAISDQHSALPHMLPETAWFESKVRGLGVSNSSHIVVYDGAGIFSAPRVWWMFRLFGHSRVQVLDGGLPAWLECGFATASGAIEISAGDFNADPDLSLVASMDDIRNNIDQREALVMDARANPRFLGEAPEPRPELSSGHMPGATSLAFTELLDNGRYRDSRELGEILSSRGVSEDTPVITSCGSGVTAAAITLALDECGYGLQRLYDGSWTEWASNPDNPIAKGA